MFEGGPQEKLLSILHKSFPDMKTAYFINHVPEQGEDFYMMLINTNVITKIEVDRYNYDVNPIIESATVNDYLQGRNKIEQIKIMVAFDLANSDLEVCSKN